MKTAILFLIFNRLDTTPKVFEQIRKENHQKGLERAKQFSWDKTVDLMVKEMMK